MDPQSLLMLVALIALFYFMLIRPQQKRLKQHQALISSLALGDEVVTIGGLYGVVRRLGDAEVVLEIAEGTLVRFSRQSISRKEEPESPEPEEEVSPTDVPEVESP